MTTSQYYDAYNGMVEKNPSFIKIGKTTDMKNIVSHLLVLIALQSIAICAQQQSTSAEDSVASKMRQFLLVDITGFPVNHTLTGSWQPYQSLRVGYGRKIVDHVEIGIYADYAWFDYDHSEGWAGKFDFSRGNTRRDISLYPAIVFFKFVEIALGCSHTTQDEVIHIRDGDTNLPITTIDPAVKKFGTYFHVGVGGTIHIAGPVGISLGAIYRLIMPSGMSLGCRAGLQYAI